MKPIKFFKLIKFFLLFKVSKISFIRNFFQKNETNRYYYKLFFNSYFDEIFGEQAENYRERKRKSSLKKYLKTQSQNPKIVVYTCITGNYDKLLCHSVLNPDCKYVCFTDNKKLLAHKKIMQWEILPLQFDKLDNIRNARWHKTHPHILFPEYEYSIWIDGNIDIISKKFYKKIKEFISLGNELAVSEHVRNCIYKEIDVCNELEVDNKDIILSQKKALLELNYPENAGLHETFIIFRKHSSEQIMNAMNEWWSWIENYSRRDQLSFDFVVYKLSLKVEDFCNIPLRISPLIKLYKHSKPLSIIIPVYNHPEEAIECINSAAKHNCEIIVVNDFSDNNTRNILEQIEKNNENVTLINNPENLGFVKSCNIGISHAKYDIVVLLNSDTSVPKNFHKKILNCFNSDKKIGIASPIASASAAYNMPMIKNLEKTNKILNKTHTAKYPEISHAEGFCICIRKKVIEQIGGLDEIYGHGYCEELDFCYRAILKGWKCVLIDDLYVYHKRNTTFGSEKRLELIKKNENIFKEKWGIEITKALRLHEYTNPMNKIIRKVRPISTFALKIKKRIKNYFVK